MQSSQLSVYKDLARITYGQKNDCMAYTMLFHICSVFLLFSIQFTHGFLVSIKALGDHHWKVLANPKLRPCKRQHLILYAHCVITLQSLKNLHFRVKRLQDPTHSSVISSIARVMIRIPSLAYVAKVRQTEIWNACLCSSSNNTDVYQAMPER
jgi:hypothetical protein